MNFNWHEVLLAGEHLTGFVIVMMALSVLWGLTTLMGRIAGRIESARPRSVVEPPAPAAATAVETADAIAEEELVVIAATVAAMFDRRHRVVSVRPIQSSWGQQGRRDIHASHRIR